MNKQSQTTDTITFLGTAGARFMVSRQLAASGGLWLNLGGVQLLVDPGPGTIVQTARRKLDPEKLDAIILSHRHLDHSSDTSVMIEAMTKGGFNRRGRVYAPSDCFGPEPVLFSYLKDFVEGITVLEEGGTHDIGPVSFSTPVRHIHTVETYGLTFKTPRHTFSYIADTRYFEGLAAYAGSDLLILNMVFTEPMPAVDHLSLPDVARIITEIKPKAAILNHYGLHVWQAKPPRLARKLAQATGIRVIAARDGMKFDLAGLDGKAAKGKPADG